MGTKAASSRCICSFNGLFQFGYTLGRDFPHIYDVIPQKGGSTDFKSTLKIGAAMRSLFIA